jgi:1,4-dihydroxy-2-naphthoate octaprenyltransferase
MNQWYLFFISLVIAVIVTKVTNVNQKIDKLSKSQQAALTTAVILGAFFTRKNPALYMVFSFVASILILTLDIFNKM